MQLAFCACLWMFAPPQAEAPPQQPVLYRVEELSDSLRQLQEISTGLRHQKCKKRFSHCTSEEAVGQLAGFLQATSYEAREKAYVTVEEYIFSTDCPSPKSDQALDRDALLGQVVYTALYITMAMERAAREDDCDTYYHPANDLFVLEAIVYHPENQSPYMRKVRRWFESWIARHINPNRCPQPPIKAIRKMRKKK